MRCILCQKLTLSAICKSCQNIFLEPSITQREVDDFVVISFYKLSDIDELIKTKYYYLGYRVYNIIAKNSIQKFAKDFNWESTICAIPIDDGVHKGFSHSAILAKYLSSKSLKPKYGVIESKSKVVYAGKSLEFRKSNPKNFFLKKEIKDDVILVDDVITTGETMRQAKDLFKSSGVNVLFGLCLADARL